MNPDVEPTVRGLRSTRTSPPRRRSAGTSASERIWKVEGMGGPFGWSKGRRLARGPQRHGLGDGEVFGVRERNVEAAQPALSGERGGGPVERDGRPPAARLQDLDIGPADARGQTGAEGLQNGLFGGEPRGDVLARMAPAAAVRKL